MPTTPSRRTVLTGLAAATSLAAGGVSTASAQGRSTAAGTSLPPVSGRRASFGVTIRSGDRQQVLSDIDHVAALGGTAIRLGAGWGDLVESPGWPGDPFVLSAAAVADMHAVLDAARARGMAVQMMWINTMHDQSWSHDDWLAKTRQWWEALAAEFATKVDQVQVFNEAGGHHYRFYVGLGKEPTTITVWNGDQVTIPAHPEYLVDLADKIGQAAEIIHRHDPSTQVTTNLYGWPVGPQVEQDWVTQLDVLSPVLDIISLDAYLDWNEWEHNKVEFGRLRERVARIRARYGKEVIIGEFGESTINSGGAEEVQRDRYLEMLDVLRATDSPIETAFAYQLHDGNGTDHEGSFGLLRPDGQPKLAYTAIADGRLLS